MAFGLNHPEAMNEKARLLIVQNDPDFLDYLQRTSPTFIYTLADQSQEVESLLNVDFFNLVICDHQLVSKQLLNLLQTKGCPYVVILEPGQEELVTSLLDNGADGYLIKDINYNWLKLLSATIKQVSRSKASQSNLLVDVMFDSSVLGLFILDQDGYFLRTNLYFQELIGYSEKEFQSMNFLELSLPQEREFYSGRFKQGMLKKINSLNFEKRYLCKSGEIVWVNLILYKLYDQNCGIKTIGIVRDITECKALEDSLKISQRELQSLISSMRDYIYIFDRDGICLKIGHFSLDDSIQVNSKIPQFWPKDVADQAIAAIRQVLDSQQTLNIELSIPINQIWKWFSININPFNINSVLWEVRDISKLKTNEENLRQLNLQLDLTVEERNLQLLESQRRYQLIFNSRLYAAFVINNYTDTAYYTPFSEVNDTACNMLGYSHEELLGKSFHSIAHSGSLTNEQISVELNNSGYIQFEAKLVSSSGKIVPTDFVLNRFEHNGQMTLLAFARDISERKQAEAKIREVNLELRRATRLKDEFLSNMSHELRTPLNAILGMTEALKDQVYGQINFQQEQTLKIIENSGKHLLDLITDILDISKIETGHLELNPSYTNIEQLCQSIVPLFQQQATKKNIQLTVKFAENIPKLLVDQLRLKQVLINLLSNAVKFTPNNGMVSLEVSTKYFHDKYILNITVIDTGIGIAQKDLSLIFQPFVQIDGSLNRQYDGTGLGLALVKKIVEMQGGEITVTSKPQQGSCFSVNLPLLGDPNTPETHSFEYINKYNFSLTPLVLLVQNNQAHIMTVSSYLKAKGYRIILAKNNDQAIESTMRENPDLILIDIEMIEINGLKTIQQIREFSHIPIIAINDLEQDHQDIGANEYLSKPLKLAELSRAIKHILIQGD